jgi:ferredoxin--NADP+ reductase
MTKILKKEQLSENVIRFRIHAPRIAKKRNAGQFIILRPSVDGERIPLTIANADSEKGWIEIVFQTVGKGTLTLGALNEGEDIVDLAGPLGKPTHIEKFGHCICVGGGVGIAPLYPIVNALRDAGNTVTVILGTRTKDMLILEKEMKAIANKVLVATDDGSYGIHGKVTDVMDELFSRGEKYDAAFVIGPAIMMKFATRKTLDRNIPTVASLNPIMIDGTGMCGGCRVTVGKETKFACVDGPEFDAEGIDWDELIMRLNGYKQFETQKVEHRCKLEGKK